MCPPGPPRFPRPRSPAGLPGSRCHWKPHPGAGFPSAVAKACWTMDAPADRYVGIRSVDSSAGRIFVPPGCVSAPKRRAATVRPVLAPPPHQPAEPPAEGAHSADVALMAGLVDRDTGALAALYDRYASLVMAVCFRVLRDHQEAEQLTFDIFTELWEKADRFNPDRGRPRTYLLTLTRSRSIDRLRRRKSARQTRGIGGDGYAALDGHADASAPAPDDRLLADEQQEQIREGLAELSDAERRAVEMSFFDDLSHREIAEKLELPLGTVKTRIRRGLLKLRDGALRRHQTHRPIRRGLPNGRRRMTAPFPHEPDAEALGGADARGGRRRCVGGGARAGRDAARRGRRRSPDSRRRGRRGARRAVAGVGAGGAIGRPPSDVARPRRRRGRGTQQDARDARGEPRKAGRSAPRHLRLPPRPALGARRRLARRRGHRRRRALLGRRPRAAPAGRPGRALREALAAERDEVATQREYLRLLESDHAVFASLGGASRAPTLQVVRLAGTPATARRRRPAALRRRARPLVLLWPRLRPGRRRPRLPAVVRHRRRRQGVAGHLRRRPRRPRHPRARLRPRRREGHPRRRHRRARRRHAPAHRRLPAPRRVP